MKKKVLVVGAGAVLAAVVLAVAPRLLWADIYSNLQCAGTPSWCDGSLEINAYGGFGVVAYGNGPRGIPPIRADNNSLGAEDTSAIEAYNFHSGGLSTTEKTAIYAYTHSDDPNFKVGVRGQAEGDQGQNYGVLARAVFSNYENFGVRGEGLQGTGENYGVYGKAANTMGTVADANYGVYGEAGGTLATHGYGVYGYASGTGGEKNYGVFGEASGATEENWAGYFKGDVCVKDGDYKFPAPGRTFYYSVPAAVCVNNYDNPDDDVNRGNGYAYVKYGKAPYSGTLQCPIHLPQGAKVEKLECGVMDKDRTGYVKIHFYDMLMITGKHDLGSATSGYSNTPGNTILSVGWDEDPPVIDNSSKAYWIGLLLYSDYYVGEDYLRAYMCRIKYTIEALKP